MSTEPPSPTPTISEISEMFNKRFTAIIGGRELVEKNRAEIEEEMKRVNELMAGKYEPESRTFEEVFRLIDEEMLRSMDRSLATLDLVSDVWAACNLMIRLIGHLASKSDASFDVTLNLALEKLRTELKRDFDESDRENIRYIRRFLEH